MRKIVLKSGDKFNFLTIVEETEKNPKSGQVQYLCLCDCGNETVQTSFNIRHGKVVSCGCYGKTQAGLRTKTHGMTKTRTYRIWAGMNNRCNNPNNQAYDRYGGAGVTVCDRWNPKKGGSFENFIEDMGECPDGYEINRKEVSNIYSKDTCEWANITIQAYDKGLYSTNSSGRTGVSYDKESGKWFAAISKEGVVYRKRFLTFEEACEYREMLEIEHYGFAKK